MGKHSNRRSDKSQKSKRGSERSRLRYEQSVDSGLAGGRRGAHVKGNAPATRVAREAAGASISNTRLAAAKNLDKAPATLLAERDRRKRRNKRRALVVLGAFCIVLVSVVAAGALYYFDLQGKMTIAKKNLPAALNTPAPKPQEPYNIVLFGIENQDGKTGDTYRSDVCILARVDPKQKKVWMVSIPRDLKTELPGKGTRKFNAAYAYGGPDLAIQTLEKISGQEIHYYMSINFYGFEDVVDAMGGIEVDVPIAINDRKADITPDGSASKIAAGNQILSGVQALTFVRSRDYPDGDYGRQRNQQIFFRALADQMTDTPLTKLPSLASAVATNCQTNLTPIQLAQFAREMRGVTSEDFYQISIPGTWRSPFIHPDTEAEAEIWRKFGKEPFETPEVVEEAQVKPAEITVTVRNGTTRAGIAKEAAAVLRARGFTVGEVGNTENQTVYDQTLIVYKSNKAAAELIAKYLPPNTKLVESRSMYRYDTEIMVVLGSDWDIAKVPVADVNTNQ